LRSDGFRIAQHDHCASSDCKRRCIPETAAQIGMEKDFPTLGLPHPWRICDARTTMHGTGFEGFS